MYASELKAKLEFLISRKGDLQVEVDSLGIETATAVRYAQSDSERGDTFIIEGGQA